MMGQFTLLDVSSFQHVAERGSVQQDTAVVFADGGSRSNPGPAGAGACIAVNGTIVESISKYCGITTSNVAEYVGLIIGLERALELGFKNVELRMDAELVVKQMRGIYRVRNDRLIPFFQHATALAKKFVEFTVTHVPREFNKDADRLANFAIAKGFVSPN
jgi:ribonuclease HI